MELVLDPVNCMKGVWKVMERKKEKKIDWAMTPDEWSRCRGVEWKWEGGKRGERWKREIRLLCILLAIHTRTFHLRSHQLSNWESDGDVRAARISTRPELGAPLRANQNTITFTARTDAHRPTPIHSFSPHSHPSKLRVIPSLFHTHTVKQIYT